MIRLLAAGASLWLAACTQSAPTPTVVETPGSIALNQAPSNDVPLGGGGHGTVFFQGNVYPFSIGGLGVDGAAVAVLRTTGQAYQMRTIADFSGTYRSAPAARRGRPTRAAASGCATNMARCCGSPPLRKDGCLIWAATDCTS